ncbi:NAD(P)H-dependent oxidoreductase, partial [Mycobacterium tuberculosis]
LVIIHPLWLGAAPAVLKAFFEQVFRNGFAKANTGWVGGLKGKSAHVVVTMGMPAPVYRLVFGGFGVRGFERGVLRLAGVGPIRTTYLGAVETDRSRCE